MTTHLLIGLFVVVFISDANCQNNTEPACPIASINGKYTKGEINKDIILACDKLIPVSKNDKRGCAYYAITSFKVKITTTNGIVNVMDCADGTFNPDFKQMIDGLHTGDSLSFYEIKVIAPHSKEIKECSPSPLTLTIM